MIAGLTLSEALDSAPGFVMDMYFMRQKYDDVLHGIKRKKTAEWGED